MNMDENAYMLSKYYNFLPFSEVCLVNFLHTTGTRLLSPGSVSFSNGEKSASGDGGEYDAACT